MKSLCGYWKKIGKKEKNAPSDSSFFWLTSRNRGTKRAYHVVTTSKHSVLYSIAFYKSDHCLTAQESVAARDAYCEVDL